ncbi:MAG: GMC family oxidoreductase [Calditrichaeota bacterium]|nr:MAG: GMC family oxidoreductase [Calditrichota bacterium]
MDYDFIIIGSGFGGAASAMRLSEKGYNVLVLEKGRRLTEKNFPKTNWNLKRWLWLPAIGFRGLFKLTFFRHVTVLSGVGVGGGSLVYANTLPIPPDTFFNSGSWSGLADWKKELMPFYREARRMMGTAPNPKMTRGDHILKEIAAEQGRPEAFRPTDVAVCFARAGQTVPDPYFDGQGPPRAGCTFCGGCMLGCRFNAKNTLDKNYLWFAEKYGAEIRPECNVSDVRPLSEDGAAGYRVFFRERKRGKKSLTTRHIIFAGGVLGTLELLLKLKAGSLPNLSPMVGREIRTNSESLLGVTTFDKSIDFSKGVAISSIYHTDEHSHLEPVRYSAGSGFWRIFMAPLVSGRNALVRALAIVGDWLRHPLENTRAYFVRDWAKSTQILLFMQTCDSVLRFVRRGGRLSSTVTSGKAPTAFIPEARELARTFARKAGGKPVALMTESLFGIPTTAHILGGCPIGADARQGVVDKDLKVFGYRNMWVCDGSVISANPGVNPSLTILALTERAMSRIPPAK